MYGTQLMIASGGELKIFLGEVMQISGDKSLNVTLNNNIVISIYHSNVI